MKTIAKTIAEAAAPRPRESSALTRALPYNEPHLLKETAAEAVVAKM